MLPYAEGTSLSICRTIKYIVPCILFITVCFTTLFFFTAAIGGHETMGRDPTMGTRNVQDRSPSLCLMN